MSGKDRKESSEATTDLKCGYLNYLKSNEGTKLDWGRRYFVLRSDGILVSFTDEKKSDVLTPAIRISHSFFIPTHKDNSSDKEHIIDPILEFIGPEPFVLKFYSNEDLEEWISVFQQLGSEKGVKVSTSSSGTTKTIQNLCREESLGYVFLYLEKRDLLNAKLVCKSFLDISERKLVVYSGWYFRFRHDFVITNPNLSSDPLLRSKTLELIKKDYQPTFRILSEKKSTSPTNKDLDYRYWYRQYIQCFKIRHFQIQSTFEDGDASPWEPSFNYAANRFVIRCEKAVKFYDVKFQQPTTGPVQLELKFDKEVPIAAAKTASLEELRISPNGQELLVSTYFSTSSYHIEKDKHTKLEGKASGVYLDDTFVAVIHNTRSCSFNILRLHCPSQFQSWVYCAYHYDEDYPKLKFRSMKPVQPLNTQTNNPTILVEGTCFNDRMEREGEGDVLILLEIIDFSNLHQDKPPKEVKKLKDFGGFGGTICGYEVTSGSKRKLVVGIRPFRKKKFLKKSTFGDNMISEVCERFSYYRIIDLESGEIVADMPRNNDFFTSKNPGLLFHNVLRSQEMSLFLTTSATAGASSKIPDDHGLIFTGSEIEEGHVIHSQYGFIMRKLDCGSSGELGTGPCVNAVSCFNGVIFACCEDKKVRVWADTTSQIFDSQILRSTKYHTGEHELPNSVLKYSIITDLENLKRDYLFKNLFRNNNNNNTEPKDEENEVSGEEENDEEEEKGGDRKKLASELLQINAYKPSKKEIKKIRKEQKKQEKLEKKRRKSERKSSSNTTPVSGSGSGSAVDKVKKKSIFRRLSIFSSAKNSAEDDMKIKAPKSAALDIDVESFYIDPKDIKITKLLGSGGSDTQIYTAKWQSMTVAFKQFRTQSVFNNSDDEDNEHFFDEFEREVALLASLSHPYILRFYGASVKPPRVGIMMELCTNGDMKNFLRKYKRVEKESYPFEKKMRMLQQSASAVKFIHNKSIIHRDIKLENVLVTEYEECRLMDFGLSRFMDKYTVQKTQSIGTPFYMAPEILKSEYDFKVDVFSFAILMFVVISEEYLPYGKKDARMVPFKVANDEKYRPDIKKLDNLHGKCPKFMVDLIVKCWDHDPEKRPDFARIYDVLSKSEKKD